MTMQYFYKNNIDKYIAMSYYNITKSYFSKITLSHLWEIGIFKKMLSRNESKGVKRMSGDCKLCTEEKEDRQIGFRNGSFKIQIWENISQDLDNEFYLNVQHFNQNIYEEDFKIKYCPICGRKLA